MHAITGKPSEYLPAKSMGRPAPGREFAIVDKDTGLPCTPGEPGELWLRGERGVQLFLEYYGNAEATEKAFDGDWFKTGDMVVLGEGGNVFYRERDKDLLKVGGENVSAREVEDVVATVPGVGSVQVVGKSHDFLDEVVVAFVIPSPTAPDEAEVGEGDPGAVPDAAVRLQGAARRVLRGRVPARHARQGAEEETCARWRTRDPRSERTSAKAPGGHLEF
ncbi:class I adenylate-forming enzyme family protein [Yinghuangia aomiensis]